jgi:hypothetical protein
MERSATAEAQPTSRLASGESSAELFPVVVKIERGGAQLREEVARLRTGQLGLDLFDAFVRAFPGCTLTLMNGRHRLRLHRAIDPCK